MIRVLIADDEQLARNKMRRMLDEETDIDVVAEASDGRMAVDAIRAHHPELIFLDVEMPELDGFGVLRELQSGPMPAIIFTTAFDQYAVAAFEAHALDYLLKPFDQERFHKALARARNHLGSRRDDELTSRLLALLNELRPDQRHLDRLVVKSNGRVIFLRADEIDWVEAAANYVCLHVGQESHLLRDTMNNFEQRLDPERFIRIHRSLIVNLDKVRELQPCNNGEYIVVLHTGKALSLSRSYRDRLDKVLQRTMINSARRGTMRSVNGGAA